MIRLKVNKALKLITSMGINMADFCKDCSFRHFGDDYRDLAGLSTPEDTANKLYCSVICEGCGFIQVDHEGVCITNKCLVDHTEPHAAPIPKSSGPEDDIEF
jgi:hypothetical protein